MSMFILKTRFPLALSCFHDLDIINYPRQSQAVGYMEWVDGYDQAYRTWSSVLMRNTSRKLVKSHIGPLT